jgi:uncharacterized protein DUF4384
MKACASTLLAILLITLVQPLHGQQAAGTVRFRFAFGALTGAGNNQSLVRITEDTHLKTGDKIKLIAEMEQTGFIYLIHRSPDGEIELLLPADLKQNVQIGRSYAIPEGASWFELDKNPGDETFYLMASTQRLSNLESLLQRYSGAPAAARPAIGTEIVSEIRKLRTVELLVKTLQ